MIKSGQKILIACDSYKSLLNFRGKLIEELSKRNKVYVFTPHISDANTHEKLVAMGVSIYENGLQGSNVSVISDLNYINKLYKIIKAVKPDIFFPYTFKPVIYGTIVAKVCRVKIITPMLSGLGYNFTQQGRKSLVSTITRRLLKISLSKYKSLKVVFQNYDDYNTLLQYRILTKHHKVHVVNGSGVDLDYYSCAAPDTDNITFLMIARLINAKGILEFYEAAQSILPRFPGTSFKLIGSYDDNIDSISPELYSKIKSGTIIQYCGEVDDVRTYIKEASVVVLPSYYGEGVPRCLLESMAMARAIITCDSVGCRETVRTSEAANGFLVPAKNVEALISKMEFYLNNKDAIALHGLNGLAYVREKFDVNLVNAEMLKIMELS